MYLRAERMNGALSSIWRVHYYIGRTKGMLLVCHAVDTA